MSLSFTSSGQRDRGTQTVQIPAASAEEQELRKLNLEWAKRQLAQLDKAEREAAAAETDPLRMQQREIESLATANMLARLKGQAPILDPGQQAALDAVYGSALRRGQESLQDYMGAHAASSGMQLRDLSPLAAREGRKLIEGLEAQRAASSLDLNSAAQNFNMALTDFQNRLRQQAYLNRLSLAGMAPPAYGMQSALFGERLATAPRAFRGTSGLSGLTWGLDSGKTAGGIGGLMQGYAAMGSGSSAASGGLGAAGAAAAI